MSKNETIHQKFLDIVTPRERLSKGLPILLAPTFDNRYSLHFYYKCSKIAYMKKSYKLNIDFSDEPKLIELLRLQAAKHGLTQKSVLIEALSRYFSDKQEEEFVIYAANRSFVEWNNPEDDVYDTL